jgi:hypothetical protein
MNLSYSVPTNGMEEKRRYHRQKLCMPLQLAPEGKDKTQSFVGETYDANPKGVGLRLKGTNGFKVGMRVALSIKYVTTDPPILANGEVRWVKHSEDGRWPVSMGINLLAASGYRSYERWLEALTVMS